MNLIFSSLLILLLLAVTAWSKPKHSRYFSAEQRNIMWDRSGGGYCENPKCRIKLSPYKGRKNSAEADHKKPFSRGGKTTLKNSLLLCRTCNRLKGSMSYEKFLKKYKPRKR